MSEHPAAGHHHDDDVHSDGHSDVPEDVALRVRSLRSLLVEKGLVDEADLDRVIEAVEHRVGPHIGARVVARAWVDPAFRARLLEDGTAAAHELGVAFRAGTRLVAVETTPDVHNLVVCTLCSCYPIPLLGLPPVWYKSAAYRSRAVSDPRSVLEEFGTRVPASTEVRVWDSNSEVRYLVLPERPAGTEGLGEEELAALVGRNAMIGVQSVAAPAPAPAPAGAAT